MDAALEIVQDVVRGPSLDSLIEIAVRDDIQTPLIVHPHPAFENGYQDGDPASGVTNALPFAFSEYLAELLGGQVDENIEQIARIGRTKMDRWQRFLYQPVFTGDVIAGAHYIIADDVVTLGATLAALRSHIVRHGGIVSAVTALAHKHGVNQQFPILENTVNEIRGFFGHGIFERWKEALGHDVQSLTEPEGLFLCEWGRDREQEGHSRGDGLLQRIRARLDQAASNGSSGEGARRSQGGRGHD
jgi:hypothetical protein